MAVAVCAVHIPIAIAMRNFPAIAMGHALACLAAGLVVAATATRIQDVAPVAAYIAGSEVLWRMCKANVFWEFGKYASVAILLVAIARLRVRRNLYKSLAYFGLLLPSVTFTLVALDLGSAREQLSSTLSGPLAIAVAVVFFSSIRLDARALKMTFVAFIAPVIGICALAMIRTETADHLDFVNAANRAASGGFGPNQVSAVLGLAVMMLILLAMERATRWSVRILTIVTASALAMQATLTFSRGGIALAIAGILSALLILSRTGPRTRITIVLVGTLCVVIGTYVIVPQVDEVTGGKLGERFLNTKASGRNELATSELRLFLESPAVGVGPSVSVYRRMEDGGFNAASHTEYTRMLAEHGLLGLISLVCLVLIATGAIKAAREPRSRAIASAMVMWSALFLGIYSTRLVAAAVALGIACACRSAIPARPRDPALQQLVGA